MKEYYIHIYINATDKKHMLMEMSKKYGEGKKLQNDAYSTMTFCKFEL